MVSKLHVKRRNFDVLYDDDDDAIDSDCGLPADRLCCGHVSAFVYLDHARDWCVCRTMTEKRRSEANKTILVKAEPVEYFLCVD